MQSDLMSHLDRVLEELREQRALIDRAIMDLERLEQGRKRPRGRPPGRSNGAHLARFHTAGSGNEIG